jgi:hypothetical protein
VRLGSHGGGIVSPAPSVEEFFDVTDGDIVNRCKLLPVDAEPAFVGGVISAKNRVANFDQ